MARFKSQLYGDKQKVADIIQFPIRGRTPDQVVGGHLRTLRETAGESQVDIATLSHVPEDEVSAWEKGEAQIPAAQLYWLSRHFKVPIASFFQL